MSADRFEEGGTALAASIERRRDEIIKMTLAQLGERPSLLAVASLERLIERVASAYKYASPFILYDWMESFLRGRGAAPTASRNLAAGMRSIEATIRPVLEAQPDLAADWTQMEACVQEIALRTSLQVGRSHEGESVSRSDATLERLIDQIDKEDQATAEHSRAVSLWCNRIARQMGLSPAEIHAVTQGGLIHDVGKLRTPPEILRAARALDPDEWVIMQAHVTHGVEILQKEPELRHLLATVGSHHERFDGRGYPSAISRYDICIGGRITAVADSFNAMIAQRPYKRPLPVRAAVAELTRNQGTQFDPLVVAAMIEVVSGETNV